MKKYNNKNKRLQFDFSNDAVKRLDAMVKTTDAASRAEVMRNALRIYEYINLKLKDGYQVELKKEDEEIIRLVPMSI